MPNIKIQEGDRAKVVEHKNICGIHFFPPGTVVQIGKRYGKRVFSFNLYYCTAIDGDSVGLTQLVATYNLEKIKN